MPLDWSFIKNWSGQLQQLNTTYTFKRRKENTKHSRIRRNTEEGAVSATQNTVHF